MKKKISILGSTGSIGTQALDVISHYPDLYEVVGLSAGTNIELLAEQVRAFRPHKVSVADNISAERIRGLLPAGTQLYWGEEGLIEIAAGSNADFVITAIVGSQGLKPTLAAVDAGKTIGLANKETLVSGGHLVTSLAAKRGVSLIPIDSEHSALFQCMNGERREDVRAITLTASGGSFRDRSRAQLAGVTVDQALKHPNWSMGAKVTIDSATMANKGLEVMEARWLFNLPYDQIKVLIHPESIIHSLVEFNDYSVMAQLGNPDMRVPIQYALTYPERMPTPTEPLNLAEIGKLHFREMDFERFPCLRMAYESGIAGGTAPTVFNAANEIAVARFLKGEIAFLAIEDVIDAVLQQHEVAADPDLEQIDESDGWARLTAASLFK
ncbi:1-deoxy-D-xylulose 5-phosphate reductoisomerase [Paenibacillus swuensis]|uniref:1-deoxy-D-xylulose 5-phosphate reductoisomerase n=1 Tax=Paenibacillus swuensis TaxID=1178515 RepID=A0A172TKK4_9BACL|nr:1-deoxy-D-xylulose-5-phosphate reductoisomerase [Paenibacillus swuensis]ANE47571.1 1-deoxy-D-xylulose 5-phosphate reductoisomerase [Paenibacillus swuensis]